MNKIISAAGISFPKPCSGSSPPMTGAVFDTSVGSKHDCRISILPFGDHRQSFTAAKNFYIANSRLFPFSTYLIISEHTGTFGIEYLSFTKKPVFSFFKTTSTLEGSSGNNMPSEPVIPPDNTDPDENGYCFHNTFEGGTFSWEGRGTAKALPCSRTPDRSEGQSSGKSDADPKRLVLMLYYAYSA